VTVLLTVLLPTCWVFCILLLSTIDSCFLKCFVKIAPLLHSCWCHCHNTMTLLPLHSLCTAMKLYCMCCAMLFRLPLPVACCFVSLSSCCLSLSLLSLKLFLSLLSLHSHEMDHVDLLCSFSVWIAADKNKDFNWVVALIHESHMLFVYCMSTCPPQNLYLTPFIVKIARSSWTGGRRKRECKGGSNKESCNLL